MLNMDKQKMIEAFRDMQDFAFLKKLACPPIYLLGGSACIIEGYLDRVTRDIDILDLEYSSQVGRLLKILGDVDYLDIQLTTLAPKYEERAKRVKEIEQLEVYTLGKEDIIVTKIGRYSSKDKEDIEKLIEKADPKLINRLITEVIERKDLSRVVKEHFERNAMEFRRDFNV